MMTKRRILREDGRIEQACEHGVGHTVWSPFKGKYAFTHGCDGRKCHTKAVVFWLRHTTPCRQCGKSPIEWHHEDHVDRPNDRVSSLVAQNRIWTRIEQEIKRCEPLCRSCHMKVDGRLLSLHINKPNQPGKSFPSSPCKVCRRLSKPLRRGMCYSCYERHRVNGRNFSHTFESGCCET